MNKTRTRLLAVVSFAAICMPLCAQRGCFHSPEAPTDVLLLVGSAGMFYGSNLVLKVLRRKR